MGQSVLTDTPAGSYAEQRTYCFVPAAAGSLTGRFAPLAVAVRVSTTCQQEPGGFGPTFPDSVAERRRSSAIQAVNRSASVKQEADHLHGVGLRPCRVQVM